MRWDGIRGLEVFDRVEQVNLTARDRVCALVHRHAIVEAEKQRNTVIDRYKRTKEQRNVVIF